MALPKIEFSVLDTFGDVLFDGVEELSAAFGEAFPGFCQVDLRADAVAVPACPSGGELFPAVGECAVDQVELGRIDDAVGEGEQGRVGEVVSRAFGALTPSLFQLVHREVSSSQPLANARLIRSNWGGSMMPSARASRAGWVRSCPAPLASMIFSSSGRFLSAIRRLIYWVLLGAEAMVEVVLGIFFGASRVLLIIAPLGSGRKQT